MHTFSFLIIRRQSKANAWCELFQLMEDQRKHHFRYSNISITKKTHQSPIVWAGHISTTKWRYNIYTHIFSSQSTCNQYFQEKLHNRMFVLILRRRIENDFRSNWNERSTKISCRFYTCIQSSLKLIKH